MTGLRCGLALILFAGYLMLLISFMYGVRKIPVQYAKRVVGRRVYGGQSTQISLRIPNGTRPIMAGVELVLMGSLLLSLFQPNGICQATGLASQLPGNERSVYPIIIIVLIFLSIWHKITIDPYDLAYNMKRSDSYIPGVSPGKETAEYLKAITTRLLPGSIGCLLILLTFPDVMARVTGFRIGLLHGLLMLLVGPVVILEILGRIEFVLLKRHYEGFIKKSKLRGRR
jgi:preprotein translocase subunit SecY